MQTPHLPRHIFGEDFEQVYEPAEDSFLLLDALENDLESLKHNNASICLECGSGSGIIITALATALDLHNKELSLDSLPSCNRLLFATDINLDACKTTKKCVDYHGQTSFVQIMCTNLAQPLVDRLRHSVDVLVFNPPYVPTEESETILNASSIFSSTKLDPTIQQQQQQHLNNVHLSWAGGEQGRNLIDIFLTDYVTKLLSKPNGVAYMIALEKNDPYSLADYLVKEHNIQGRIVLQRRAGFEHLYVVKYEWLK